MSLMDAVQLVAVTLPDTQTSSAWSRAVTVLLETGAASRRPSASALGDRSAADVAGMTTNQLLEELADVPRGPQKAGVLRLLAQWWVNTFGDDVDPIWSADPQHYREELRRIRGLGPETVDRLLLFAARLPVVPIDRGTLRVLVRHGWLDLPVEDEGAQATFRGAFGEEIDVLQRAVLGLQQVGRDFCGREPACGECPLRPMLPDGGPLNPDAC